MEDEFMTPHSVELLDREETIDSTIDARIVAIRWDLLMWGLVLDCDCRAFGERPSNAVKRLWVAFSGIDDISLTLDSARLPRGIFGASSIVESVLENDWSEFRVSLLAPKFSEDRGLMGIPRTILTIKAKKLLAVRSIAIGDFGEFSGDATQRNSLAGDDDFLDAIKIHL